MNKYNELLLKICVICVICVILENKQLIYRITIQMK